MTSAKIGVIGGSGLYSMPGFTASQEVKLETPFGDPSDAYIVGELEGKPVAFLARHGRGHRISPSELNFRANIHGFKQLGVEWIISLSAVGSLKEEHKPLDFVIPDQFVDRTRGRVSTFFGEGLVAHISFADPVCPVLMRLLHEACREAGVPSKLGGTYLCMEGPAFSTKAESSLYRSWGMDVIGMTNLQEAKLAARGRDLLLDRRDGHRLRLLAPRARRRHRRRHRPQPAAQCGERRQSGACGGAAAGCERGALLHLQPRSRARAHHGQESRSCRDAEEAGADRWQVFRRMSSPRSC